MRLTRGFAHTLLAAGLVLGVSPAMARAQVASAPELKAAFLLNFARLADWPDAIAVTTPLTLCIFGDDRVALSLTVAVRDQLIGGHRVDVIRVEASAAVDACHLLFVGSGALSSGTRLLARARALPVLTVSDGDRFAKTMGMIELFAESGRMRFAINVDAVGRARLHLSSRLLALAKIVRDKNVP